mmetsp:Transcript_12481/g.34312  ORF Transcript_12481/g.34312 Transcript_12481/m.34312 type:complete len:262 (+) Transcript_12481:147-932(+)
MELRESERERVSEKERERLGGRGHVGGGAGLLHDVVDALDGQRAQRPRLVRVLGRRRALRLRLLAQHGLLVLRLERDGHLRLRAVLVVLELLALLLQILLRVVHERVDVVGPLQQRVRAVLQLVRLARGACELLEGHVRRALVLLRLDHDGLVLVRQLRRRRRRLKRLVLAGLDGGEVDLGLLQLRLERQSSGSVRVLAILGHTVVLGRDLGEDERLCIQLIQNALCLGRGVINLRHSFAVLIHASIVLILQRLGFLLCFL